jgi:hypothetical protein
MVKARYARKRTRYWTVLNCVCVCVCVCVCSKNRARTMRIAKTRRPLPDNLVPRRCNHSVHTFPSMSVYVDTKEYTRLTENARGIRMNFSLCLNVRQLCVIFI